MGKWIDQFRRPGAEYRGTPFWAWNAKLDRKELVRQVGEFQRGGFGGFFMHVRSGLATEYLSPEFMACVKAVVAEAKKRGMQAWLYDEDRWSSGFGGGRVTRNPEYGVRALVWERIAAKDFDVCPEDAVACFSVLLDGINASMVRRLGKGERPPAGHDVIVYRVKTQNGMPWYNYTSYVDTMNPAAIRAFIDSTHEVYKASIGSEFGRTVPGIFTDEPNYGGFYFSGEMHGRAYPWTGRFLAEFRLRKGYDLDGHLMELSHRLDGQRFSSVRHDYRDVATQLYTEAYSRQIGEWCTANGLEFTGHQLAETDLEGQTDRVGACMRHYEWFHRPGIDVLGDELPEVLTAKQAVSVASQLGRNRVLSENFGCTGWDATFALYRRIGDWHQVLGVNHFCPHLSWYSMEGDAKRDYPASIFEQSPWWEHHSMLADYFGRLSLALSQGRAVREVCVIHPVESAWGLHIKRQNWMAAGLTESLNRLCGHMLDNQFDFDFADELLLEKYGSISTSTADVRLVVGQMRYRVVVVPECVTLRRSTSDRLRDFASAGGRVVFLGTPPAMVDGVKSAELVALAERSPQAMVSSSSVVALLGDDCRAVRILGNYDSMKTGEPGVWTHVRRTEAGEVLFVVNMDKTNERRLRLGWTGEGVLEELDPVDGGRSAVAGAESSGGMQIFTTVLPASGSRLYLRTAGRNAASRTKAGYVESLRIGLADEWRYGLSEPNVLVLDNARMRAGGGSNGAAAGKWRARRLLWLHEAELRDETGLSMDCAQPYIRRKIAGAGTVPVELEFEIQVESVPVKPLFLAMEHPERFTVSVNGSAVEAKDSGWYIDRSLRKISLGGIRLRAGVNRLCLSTVFDQEHRFEDVFLLGQFGVRNGAAGPVITSMPARLRNGDWCHQGLAMYGGSVRYARNVRIPELKPGQRAVLAIDRPEATVIAVAVNGCKPVVLGWGPWELDVTDSVKSGSNSVEITVFSSRRNTLGPLHCRGLRPAWIGTAELRPGDDNRTGNYKLVPYGLLGQVYVSIKERIHNG